jgi:hypothetical protein
MATNPWDADPVVEPTSTFTGVIPGAPKAAPIPSGYEADPAKPGAVRPIAGGPNDPSANDTLDDATRTFYAQQVLAGAPMPAMGMGKVASQNRQAVMKKVAELAGAQGLGGADLARQITHYKAQSANVTNLEKQLGTVEQNEATALANGQQFIDRSAELPGQTQYPALNSVTQFAQRNLPVPGHETVSAMDAAYNTFVNEYAKVVAGSPNGSGVLSDSARHEAMETIRSNASLSQKQAAFAQMKADMANRIAASHKAIEDSYKNLTAKPGYEVPSDLGLLSIGGAGPGSPPPPSGGSGGGGGGGSTPPGLTDLSDDQKAAYSAFLAANPKPDAPTLKTFLEKLTGKQVTNADAISAAIAKGAGVSTTVEDKTKEQKISALADDFMKQGGGPGAAAVAGVADTVGLGFSDELGGALNAFGGALEGKGSFGDLYDINVGANREYQRRLTDQHPVLYHGGQIAGGVLLPAGEVSGAFDAAKLGAAYGGAYGAGSAEGGLAERASGALAGAAAGATVGAGASALSPYVAKAVEPLLPISMRAPRGLAPDVADAAKAEGVDLIRPMVDPTAISDYGALESNVYSQPIIRGAAGRVRGQIEDRAEALSQGGTPLEPDAAGGVVQDAGRRFIQRSKGVANALYNRARTLAGDKRFVPQNAIDQIEAEVAQLRQNPETNAGEINFLEGLHSDLASPGGKTVDELRQLRTSLRGRIAEQNLTATQAEARAVRALDATQQDVAANAPEAATAYRRADTYYRERQTHIDDIVKRLTGGKVGTDEFQVSGEQAFQRLKSMASPGGDGRRLGALMRDLDPNERQDIAATIAQSLGRRAPDEPFSTALFLSQTRKLSPSARRTIFGPDGAQSIDNLRLLSRKLEEAGKDINRSRSATVLERQGIRTAARAFITGLAGLGSGVATGSISGGIAGVGVAGTAMGVSAVRRVLSARAMVNPRVSRWLAEAADASTPAQAKEATRKLGVTIAREPAIAHELQPVYQFLQNRLELPLAASPDQPESANNEQQ